MKKNIQRVTIFLFVFWLFISLVMVPFPKIKLGSLSEYRTLKPFPKQTTFFTAQWNKEFTDWFNDHFFFRTPLVRLAGTFNYYIFKYSDRVYVGKNNTMYYRNVMDNELYQNYLTYNKDQFATFFKMVASAKSELDKKGVKFIIIVCPQKYQLYPENLPAHIPNTDPTYLDSINEKLRNLDDIIFIDALQILKNLKAEGKKAYHATDFHWTDPAGATVSRYLLQTIAVLEKISLTLQPLQIDVLENLVGDQSRFLPLFKPIKEESVAVHKNFSDVNMLPDIDTTQFEFISQNSGDSLLPSVTFVGNSYGDAFIRSGFHTYMKKFYKINRYVSLMDAIALMPSDTKYLIWQIIEVQLGKY
nr:hypothetical protein [uncultured Desulfobacter sp.]